MTLYMFVFGLVSFQWTNWRFVKARQIPLKAKMQLMEFDWRPYYGDTVFFPKKYGIHLIYFRNTL